MSVGGVVSKPSRELRLNENVLVNEGLIQRRLVVRGVPPARIGAKLVPEFCEDLTPASEYEKVREQRVQQFLARERGSGRPTKRDRRLLDGLFSS